MWVWVCVLRAHVFVGCRCEQRGYGTVVTSGYMCVCVCVHVCVCGRFKDYGDDRAMVAGWRDVQAEEKRSERMGEYAHRH